MSTTIRSVTPWALVLGAVFLPELAAACAVCGGGDDLRVKDSYIDATIFMSVLPLAVIGGGVFTLRRRFRARDAELAAGFRTFVAPKLGDRRGSEGGIDLRVTNRQLDHHVEDRIDDSPESQRPDASEPGYDGIDGSADRLDG